MKGTVRPWANQPVEKLPSPGLSGAGLGPFFNRLLANGRKSARTVRARHSLRNALCRGRCLPGLWIALGALACGSQSTFNPELDASVLDAGEGPVDASVADAAEASDASGAEPVDAGGDCMGSAGTSSPVGDRNLCVVAGFPAAALVQNGGRVIDITRPPAGIGPAALGNGQADDTAAFVSVFDFLKAYHVATTTTDPNSGGDAVGGYWVYLPDGEYSVSDTLGYSGTLTFGDAGDAAAKNDDLQGIHIVGQSREKTIIRLKDGSDGFNDPSSAKVVLAYANPTSNFNDRPGSAVLENVTIDVGANNPGAVGLAFHSANIGAVTNVLLRSESSGGGVGALFPVGSVESYLHDITVLGFDTGLLIDPAADDCYEADILPTVEHITLSGQRRAGIDVGQGSMTLRAALIDESSAPATSPVPAVRMTQVGTSVVLVDSELRGSGGVAIELDADPYQALFSRNVAVSGYSSAVQTADGGVAGSITEYENPPPPVVLFDGSAPRSFALPVEDAPQVSWFDPETDWANVDDFDAGPSDDGGPDDTEAAQAALQSGKPVVYFNKARYRITRTLTVPATVQRIDALYASTNDATFDVNEASATPLVIRGLAGFSQVVLSAVRPIVIQNSSAGFSDTVHPDAGAVSVFIENGANIGSNQNFAPAGAHVWARGLNDEVVGNGAQYEAGLPPQADIQGTGGTVWVLGFKTEQKPAAVLSALQGSRMEVLGGAAAVDYSEEGVPLVYNNNSNVTFGGFELMNGGEQCMGTEVGVTEVRSGVTRSIAGSSLPPRHPPNGYCPPCFFLPLYVGYDPAALDGGS